MRRYLLFAFTFASLCVGSAVAQSPPPSIFVYESSRGGVKADAAAAALEGQLFADLFKKYPCMDMTDKQGVQGILDFERIKDLVGAEPNDALLAQLGGAVGARYVVNVNATQLPNGTVYMQVVVLDTVTGKAVARRDAPPASDQTVNSAIATLKAQALADMANFLQGKCDEHWTGSISYIYKYDDSGSKVPSALPNTERIHTEFTDNTTASDEIYVILKPMTFGSTDPSRPKAQATRMFEYHHTSSMETRMQVRCRPRGANSYLRSTTERRNDKMDETGGAKDVLIVIVNVYNDGRYAIRLDQKPDLITKWTSEHFEQRPGGCEDPPPMTANSNGENSVYAGPYKRAGGDISGQVDPKNPDILAGTFTSGNKDAGIETITWNLRRVRPKNRNDK
jgi:hypothetical protein